MIKLIYISILLFITFTGKLHAQDDKVPPVTRILFILDASGSMEESWVGRSRMQVAKETLSRLVDSLKSQPKLELALRVYGHEWDKRYMNCKDTKLEVGFAPNNHETIKSKIKTIEPKGTTLISYSLEQAASDFPTDKNSRNVLILITDGIEACGGDPCALSLALQKKDIFLKPFIIGMGADKEFAKAFECMGQYYDANDPYTFKRVMDKVLVQTLEKTTLIVNLLDTYNKPTETNVDMTFVNNFTKKPVYDFVHLIKANGKSEAVEVDAILSYDIVVNTIPVTIKKDIKLEGGKENIVDIKTPQGALKILDNYNEYTLLKAHIRQNNKSEVINTQTCGSTLKYLTGVYDIEVLTLPKTNFSNVKIEQSKTTTLTVPAPGVLNITDNVPGYGSLYLVKDSGEHEWIYTFEKDNSKINIALQPGNYKFVFRSDKTTSVKYTDVQLFTIRSGQTTNLRIFKR